MKDTKNNKEPKDLGIKIGSKEEAFWTQTKDLAQKAMDQGQHEIIINEAILELAERKIKKEKEKV